MAENYSLNLPDWGPYNKNYLGASHVTDGDKGLRFEVDLFPGYYRRSVMSPKTLSDCGAKMLAASADLSRFIYRYELEWKDKVYIDADFRSENNRLSIICDFVNNTDFPESLTLNAVMSMHGCTQNHREIIPSKTDAKWLDALDYKEIGCSQFVASDGLYTGEMRESGFVGGSFISSHYFGAEGDFLSYEIPHAGLIGIRYRGFGFFTVKTERESFDITLPKTENPNVFYIKTDIPSGRLMLLPHDAEADIDGFVFDENAVFYQDLKVFSPKTTEDAPLSMDFDGYKYEAFCNAENFTVRKLFTDDTGGLLSAKIHDHVSYTIGDLGREHIDLFIRPVFVDANSRKQVIIEITAPDGKDFNHCHSLSKPVCNPSGEKYRTSQQIMSAVTLSNVVWPVYCRRGYIKHNTPGRNWDSLYTWDSGFIGMGLAELDINRAKDCLNAYMTPVSDRHSPYIFHGTPLPTQIFLYAEIFNKTGDTEFLREFYPYLRQQYRFFADMRKTSRVKKTGMFALWDIFYNSGGWDDYPTQKYIHDNRLEDAVCPVINTATTVLFGKILKNLAGIAGFDTSEYDEDISFYTDAVNNNAWDEDSGYYSYVTDEGILKINGVNADMGLDGAYPFIAGISSPERSARILDNIKNGLMTDIGLSVVDTRAPYYRKDGYWNGSVWMPHQWILWKALLDNGETHLAVKIPETALALWEKEVSLTYNCYEHFMIANGRGAGFHQFSGLSTPTLMWFSALYRPYTVTGGFMSVITEKTKTEDGFRFRFSGKGAKPSVIVCLEEGKNYKFETSGVIKQINNGAYVITYNSPVDEKIFIKEEV